MREPTSPLRAMLLSDGRPGHYHLSEGILAAIARRRAIAVTRLEVRRPRWLPGRVLSAATNAGLPPARLLSLAYGLEAADLPPTDLVVSAGGDTLAANIATARLTGARNIFYGSLRRFRPRDFALVLTSYSRNAGLPNHAMTPKPSRLDPGDIPLARRVSALAEASPGPLALLVGGESGEARWTGEDWDALLALVRGTHAATATRWLVSTSRRTPDAMSDRLAALAAEADGPIARFVDVRTSGAGTLEDILRSCSGVAVTADSSSMLSEAIWACRPVVSLAPRHLALTANEADYRAYLEDQGWCRSLALAGAGPPQLLAALAAVMPLRDNPLDLLATLIAHRLPGLLPPD